MTGTEPESELVAERLRVPERPAHLSIGNVGLVVGGGTVGTALRYGLTLALPPLYGVPIAILTVNVVGAFVLGLLLEALSELGPDHGVSRRIRLGVGTGVLGGFTTYSTLAVDTLTIGLHSARVAIAYGLATVVLGGAGSILGIAVARRWIRPMITEREAAR